MIWRVGASAAALAPLALQAVAASGGATLATSQPVIWHFLGYPFEAAGMIAALFGCLATRFWIGAGQALRREHRWALDLPVSGAVLALTVAIIISRRPEPIMGLIYGLGTGMIGEGVFKLAEKYMGGIFAMLLGADPETRNREP